MTLGGELLSALCNSVERACLIAVELKRFLCNSLIEAKEDELKNENAQSDFKTFADVLIQQVIIRDLESSFSELKGHVFGEESDKITVHGKVVPVKLSESDSDVVQTTHVLSEVLKNKECIGTLIDIIHRKGKFQENLWMSGDFDDFEIDLGNLAFWIDPIDCTKEYIKAAIKDCRDFDNRRTVEQGLPCVTCLVGAFDVTSGTPILGVIAQPFVSTSVSIKPRKSEVFKSELFWGICTPKLKATNINQEIVKEIGIARKANASTELPVTVLSKSSNDFLQALSGHFDSIRTCGAGKKCLTTLLGFSDCFINSSGGVYFWDMCGPHAILLALGGEIFSLIEFKENGLEMKPIRYAVPSKFPLEQVSECCLKNGFIYALEYEKVLSKLKPCFLSE